jgi:hypothetical protein
MRHKWILSAFTLGAALAFGVAAIAADLPKEGTYSGTFSGFGAFKATPIGKERLLVVWDETAMSLTNGLLDHFTWRCFGESDVVNGVVQDRGRCVGTDPAGDQVVVGPIESEKHGPDLKSWKGTTGAFMAGTGKYTGITGSGTYEEHGGEFRAVDGTFVSYSILKGSYKLP